MLTPTTEIRTTCRHCGAALAPTAGVCENCRTLVYAEEMERGAEQARTAEAQGQFEAARQQWLAVLPLLPPDSKQAEWIRKHADELQKLTYEQHRPKDPNAKSKWVKRLGPLAPIAVLLAKFKGLFLLIFKLKFLLSFAAFIGVYWSLWGPKFGIGFAVLILIHEMGHYVEIRRRGLPAELPMFIPGLVAYVKWDAIGVSLQTRAAVSLAGPLAGFLSAAACGFIFLKTGDPVWAALANTGAWLNVLNLIPIWVLDGAGAAKALNLMEKFMVLAVSVGLGYATGEMMFYIVAGGMLINIVLLTQRRPAMRPVYNTIPSQPNAAAYALPESSQPAGSQMIAAYYIAVLAALGGLLFLLHNSGIAH